MRDETTAEAAALQDPDALRIGYAVQLERRVKSENAVSAQFARRGEAVDYHPVRRQMGRDGSEDLAPDALDVAGAQMMPEQAGDIGRLAGLPKAAANSARVKTGCADRMLAVLCGRGFMRANDSAR